MSDNAFNTWNRSKSSLERATDQASASNRILSGFFTPRNLSGAAQIHRCDPVFAMGSCFAREIEGALRRNGYTISSLDLERLAAGPFSDEIRGVRTGFFHRFNIPSMELEFRRAVGDVPFDEENDLAVERHGFADLHYHPLLARLDRAGMMERRRIAREMTARFVDAKYIVITLGLTEAIFHLPSQKYCNSVPGDILARRRNDFEIRVIGIEENMKSLAAIYDCIKRHHVTGDFTMFVTVSPVPLSLTFFNEDIVVANSRSKATLRAVAEDFCLKHANAIYYPSYEIAMYSDQNLVWRPDRIHVDPRCVEHIVSTFLARYGEGGTESPAQDRVALVAAG